MPGADDRRDDDAGTAPTMVSVGGAAPSTEVRRRMADAAPPEPSSEVLARYELIDELGRGGMGLVVSARDKRLGRTVALKVLHGDLQEEPAVLRRFLVEAQVGAQLEHPNIVPVYGMEDDGGAPAFTMRLLEGQTLRAYLADCRRHVEAGTAQEEHSLPERIERFLKLCDAIAYAHAQGVIHRDLKPDNVILGEHGEVYLVDWGIAKVLGGEVPEGGEAERPTLPAIADAAEAAERRADGGGGERAGRGSVRTGSIGAGSVSVDVPGGTQHGELVGTPAYMPPEQASGVLEAHGPASDQFALGMMLQELITLEMPRGGALMEQIFMATRGERAPLEKTFAGARVPPPLKAIVARATRSKPEDRYPSVDDFADDLRRFARGEEVSVHRDPWTTRLFRRLSRRPAVVVGVVASVLLLALGAATVSLAWTLREQERAAAERARLGALTADVVRRSEAIDARFARARALVEGLGVATEELLAYGQPDPGPLAFGVAGRLIGERGPRLEGLHPVERYGFEVTFAQPLYLYPPGVAFEAVEPTLRTMPPLSRHFRDVLLRSHDAAAPSWPRARQDALLDGGETPLHVTYVGFEDGLLLNYPGYEPFPDDYDPRRRPWYREAREAWGVHFGRPYPDASGSAILVPCNRAVRGPDGTLLGVAGADMALDDLARAMRLDAAGWIRTSLIDAEGRQIIDTEQEGLRLGVGLHDDAPIEATPLAPALWAAIRRDGTGWARDGDELVVFDAVEELGWTLAARFDARVIAGR